MRHSPISPNASLRALRAVAAILLTVVGLTLAPAPASAAEIVVFAAASLKEALDEAARIYGSQTGDTAKISYAASPAARSAD